MARGGRSSSRGSSSRGSFGSRSSSRSQSPPRQQPRPTQQQTQQPTQGMGGGGLGSMLMTGMAFGAGSAVAHQAVRSMTGGHGQEGQTEQVQQGNTQPQEQSQQQTNYQQQNPCLEINTKFVDCLKRENNDISSCQSLFNDLKSCEKDLFR